MLFNIIVEGNAVIYRRCKSLELVYSFILFFFCVLTQTQNVKTTLADQSLPHLSIYPSAHLPFHLLFVCSFVHLFVHSFVCLSIHPFIGSLVGWFICSSICSLVCSFVHLVILESVVWLFCHSVILVGYLNFDRTVSWLASHHILLAWLMESTVQ